LAIICAALPTVTVGSHPTEIAVDSQSDTVYVANANNSLTLIDGRTCNASQTSGCGQVPAQVSVGSGPEVVAVDAAASTAYVANSDESTHTVYVSNAIAGTVSLIDASHCNASTTVGC
jgi:DNA-binding beta-propeller fold protein YncE